MARSQPEDESIESFEDIEEDQEKYKTEDVYLVVEENLDVSQLLADLEDAEGVVFGGRTRDSVEEYRKGL